MPALPPETDLFDALRANWQQGNEAPAVHIERLRTTAESELRSLHRRHLRSTVFVSASFVAAISVTSWVYVKFNDHGPLFYGSIVAINLLMIFMAMLMWLGVQHDKSSAALHSRAHIDKTLRKLRYRKFTAQYAMPVYMVILLASLYAYYTDVLAPASFAVKLAAYAGTALYCGLTWWWSRRKWFKNLNDTKRLIGELEQLKAALENPE
ncbi:MAG: hypothetical protein MUC87_01405 [Bacteroidia bacterium]|jgi:hypothetical protein|nr:hypothetical protein [Bacteroidia bacterium]